MWKFRRDFVECDGPPTH
nr:hypothetical protein [Escherichia coli]